MRILLINQSNGVHPNQNPPLGVLYLAACARRAGAEVRLHDQGAPESASRFPSMEEVRALDPDLVGISVYTFGIQHTIRFVEELKRSFPRVKVVLGGHHATALPERTMADVPGADYLAVGEGEDTLVELLGALRGGGDVSAVRGLVYRSGDTTARTLPRELIRDLDSRPHPANDLIEGYSYASEGIRKGRKVLNLVASRGCPFQCAYCNKAVYGNSYRQRSAAAVLDEVEAMFAAYGYDEVMFHDELFTANRRWVEEFLAEMERRQLRFPWRVLGRVGLVDADLLRNMRDAGCYVIAFGLEAGNDAVRRDIGRKMENREIVETFRMARDAGLLTYAFNMINHRLDTRETIRDTYDLMVAVNATFAPVFVCSPFPGSRIHGLLPDDAKYDWNRFNSYRDFRSVPISLCAVPEDELTVLAEQMESHYYSRLAYLRDNLRLPCNTAGTRTVILSLFAGYSLIKLKHIARDRFFVARGAPGRLTRAVAGGIVGFLRSLLGPFRGIGAVARIHGRL